MLFRTTARLWRKKSSSKSARNSLWYRPQVERLERRDLLSFTLGDVLTAYNIGANTLAQLNTAASIASQALDLNKIPLVNETLSSALGIAKDIQTPFQTVLDT